MFDYFSDGSYEGTSEFCAVLFVISSPLKILV